MAAIMETNTTRTDDGGGSDDEMAMVAVTTAVGKMRGMPAFPDHDALTLLRKNGVRSARHAADCERDGVRAQDRGRMAENRDRTKTSLDAKRDAREMSTWR